jgi:hypothetical protein
MKKISNMIKLNEVEINCIFYFLFLTILMINWSRKPNTVQVFLVLKANSKKAIIIKDIIVINCIKMK